MTQPKTDSAHRFSQAGFPLAVKRLWPDQKTTASCPYELTAAGHSHDFCQLAVVTHGRAHHRLEERTIPVSAGDVFLLQGGRRHCFHGRHDLRLVYIMYEIGRIGLPSDELRRMPGYNDIFVPEAPGGHRFAARLHLKREQIAHVEQLAEEMERECVLTQPCFEMALRAKLTELIIFLVRTGTQAEPTEASALLRVGHVIGRLENEFACDWSVEELLSIAHMSRSTFMRVFRRATGQTPINYLVRRRIQQAMHLLRNSDEPVARIALAVGFSDSNYFTRRFHRMIGKSPRAFRRAAG